MNRVEGFAPRDWEKSDWRLMIRLRHYRRKNYGRQEGYDGQVFE